MPLFNTAAFIRETLDSILAQNFQDFELIIVDDCSTDGSVKIVESYSDPRIRLLKNETNIGVAAARNLGLDAAKGEFLAFFDSDDVALPGCFETKIKLLNANPRLQIIGSRMQGIDHTGTHTKNLWGYSDTAEKLSPTLLFRNVLCTSGLTMRREIIGGKYFRTDLPVASDYEMWVRLVDNTNTLALSDIMVKYREHPSNITHSKREFAHDCVRRILEFQLNRFGIHPTAEELEMHRLIGIGRPDQTHDFLDFTEAWLLRLYQANQASSLYLALPFNSILATNWYLACIRSASLGWRILSRFEKSPLAALEPVSSSQRYRMLKQVVKAKLKKLFPFLWPAK